MKMFTLKPDEHMKWIYDPRFKDDPHAIDLRKRREAALKSCPQWELEQAALNDMQTQNSHTEESVSIKNDVST